MGKGATTKANQPQTECILTGAAPLSVLTVNLMNYGGSWENLKEGFKKADPTLKDIPGLGEDAFTFMGGVVAKKGDRYVSVGGMLSNAPMTQVDGAKFLAGKILAEI